ncbi:MAG: hypothetical protein AAF223_00165 [Bacteroidota bacterium]
MSTAGGISESLGAALTATGEAMVASPNPGLKVGGALASALGTYFDASGDIINSNGSTQSSFQGTAGAIAGGIAAAALGAAVITATGIPLTFLGGLGLAIGLTASVQASSFIGKQVFSSLYDLFNNGLYSPLVIDLDKDGKIELSPLFESTVRFNFDADGYVEQSGWVNADDGLLVLDRNNNGTIDDITELFGNQTTDGFVELAALDSNNDGIISASDTQFSDLEVWRDLNQDGISQASELESLSTVGIQSIDLNYSNVNLVNQGHEIYTESNVTWSDNSTSLIQDVWFEISQVNSLFVDNDNLTLDFDVFDLPQLRGYGNIPDLWAAMTLDSTLRVQVENLVNANHANFDFNDFRADVENILFKWFEVETVPVSSRGSYIDARKLESFEKIFDQDFFAFNSSNPNINTGVALELEWGKLVDSYASKILVQLPYQSLQEALLNGIDALNDLRIAGTVLENMTQSELETTLDPIFVNIDNDLANHPLKWLTDIEYDFNKDQLTGSFTDLVNEIANLEPGSTAQKIDYWYDNLRIINAVADSQFISDTDYENALTSLVPVEIYINTIVELRSDNAVFGSESDDILSTLDSDSYAVGRGGNDSIYAGDADDLLIYNLGDGDDYYHLNIGNDTMIFGDGITTSNIQLVYAGALGSEDLEITFSDGSTIFIDYGLRTDTNWGIENYKFSDNTTLSNADISAMTLSQAQTDGDDLIKGYKTDDTIDGGLGNDSIYAEGGNDLLIYNLGDGNDIYYLTRGEDVISFGTGISADNISFTQLGSPNSFDLEVTMPDAADITLNYQLQTDRDFGIEIFQFADGSSYNSHQVAYAVDNNVSLDSTNGFVTITDSLISSYSDQDTNPVSVTTNGGNIELTGNTWKKIDYNVTITADTVLEFDFTSNQEGEIHGIGLDDDNNQNTGDGPINLYGTQSHLFQTGPAYTGNGSVQSYSITLADYYTIGDSFTELVFVNDKDGGAANAHSLFENIRVFEDNGSGGNTGGGTDGLLDFANYSLSAYSDQDTNPVSVTTNGADIEITGNSWKKIDYNVTITADTVLEFDFTSNQEGEIHAIGFDNDNNQNTDFGDLLQFFGTQGVPTTNITSYTGNGSAQSYSISLSDYYTIGDSFTQLVFANDHDAPTTPTAHSFYENIRIFEDTGGGNSGGNNYLDFTAYTLSGYTAQDTNPISVTTTTTSLEITGNSWKKIDYNVTITEDTVLEFDFTSNQEGEIHAIGFDTDNSFNTDPLQMIKLYGTQNPTIGDGPDYTGNGTVQHYIIQLSDYFTIGDSFTQMAFANDHDAPATPTAHSLFENIQIYEAI